VHGICLPCVVGSYSDVQKSPFIYSFWKFDTVITKDLQFSPIQLNPLSAQILLYYSSTLFSHQYSDSQVRNVGFRVSTKLVTMRFFLTKCTWVTAPVQCKYFMTHWILWFVLKLCHCIVKIVYIKHKIFELCHQCNWNFFLVKLSLDVDSSVYYTNTYDLWRACYKFRALLFVM
jgi:hypothetical protein